MNIKIIFLSFILLVGCTISPGVRSANEPSCTIADVSQGIILLDWTKNAMICNLGNYNIAVPANGKSNTIFIWDEKGPVMLKQDDLGLILYNQNPPDDTSKLLEAISKIPSEEN